MISGQISTYNVLCDEKPTITDFMIGLSSDGDSSLDCFPVALPPTDLTIVTDIRVIAYDSKITTPFADGYLCDVKVFLSKNCNGGPLMSLFTSRIDTKLTLG